MPAPAAPCGLGGTCELPTAPAACDEDDAEREKEAQTTFNKSLLKTAEGQLSVQSLIPSRIFECLNVNKQLDTNLK